jgi:hypothetical protein
MTCVILPLVPAVLALVVMIASSFG